MKPQNLIIVVSLLLIVFSCNNVIAQTDTGETTTGKIYIINTYNGGEFIGEITFQDMREVIIDTRDRGKISIPKYQIEEMREIKSGDLSPGGEFIPEEVFATRYFITTNGLPVLKGENYSLWNLYGPDFQFGISDNLNVGVMTSWFGMPIIGTAKYTLELAEKVNLGFGALLGTGSWAAPDYGLALPYVALTFGDRRNNINFSGGYGAIWYDGTSEGKTILSVAGMSKVGKNISLVFDSFIVPDVFGLIIPGIQIQHESKKAFQFGFGGIYTDGEFIPVPIPIVQWFRKF